MRWFKKNVSSIYWEECPIIVWVDKCIVLAWVAYVIIQWGKSNSISPFGNLSIYLGELFEGIQKFIPFRPIVVLFWITVSWLIIIRLSKRTEI